MIPVFETVLLGNEKRYVDECLETKWISSEGAFVRQFENAMSDRFGMPEAVAVSSGTGALETGLHSLDLPEGSEVIMPSLTIISCAYACLRVGLTPVLVDIDPDTWTMDVRQLEAKLTSRTAALMVVHLFGNPVNMDPVLHLARRRGIPVMEDFAEAQGAAYRGESGNRRLCGAMGEVAATSFYANKLISCGEGGMVLCRDPQAAERARRYRNLGFGAERDFLHADLAANFRITNLQAAFGLAQLERLDHTIQRKREIAEWYRKAFADHENLLRFHPVPSYSDPVYWMFSVELNSSNGVTAADARRSLHANDIDTRPFFQGLHRQPVLLSRGLFAGEEYPHTEYATRYAFYLPSSLSLTREIVERIAATLIDSLGSR
jgi:perosamine synthetase